MESFGHYTLSRENSTGRMKILSLGRPLQAVEGLYNGRDFDIDVCAILVLENGRVFDDEIVLTTDTIQILDANDRADLLRKLPSQVASKGPYQGLITRLSPAPFEPFDGTLLSHLLPDLRIVVSAQVGYNDFDIDWMNRHGIWFCNSKFATCEATAEMALFLIFAVLRNTSRTEKNLREGRWRAGLGLGKDPAGLTLGIVGMGKVGEKLARKASLAFGMRVIYWNKSGRSVPASHMLADPEAGSYRRCDTLEELLQHSDVISLHCPLSTSTTNLISYREFGMMRHGSYFINTSRGALVNDEALIDALETGKVCRAGLDVFDGEPNRIHAYYAENVDKVVVQPHMGGLTQGSFAKATEECLANLRAYLETGKPLGPVNEAINEGEIAPRTGVMPTTQKPSLIFETLGLMKGSVDGGGLDGTTAEVLRARGENVNMVV